VERGEQLTGEKVAPGHVLLGIASSGVHSNGYSLVRRLASDKGWQMDTPAPFDSERSLVDALIEPTRIYVKSLLPPVRSGRIDALAHITGGGLLENIPRVLPEGAHAVVDADSWTQPGLMAFLQAEGNIEPAEMVRTFNCGVGMVLAVLPELASEVVAELEAAGEEVMHVGVVAEGPRGCTVRGGAGSWGADEAWSATHEA
jgi:phosphoribosylformylglycinamidine cyclo-ligase